MRWLLLRGLTREKRHWGAFPKLLEQRLGAEVVLVDLPGVGTENARRSPSTISEIVEDVRARSLGEEPTAILAISLGGMVAMQWCHRYPDDFSHAVIINSSAKGLSRPWDRLRLARVPQIMSAMRTKDLVERELRILGMTTATRGSDRALAQAWAEFAKERPVHPSTARDQVAAALRFDAPPQLAQKSLVLWAAADAFTAPSCSRALCAHLGSSYGVHPTAGHDLPLDDPDWVTNRIEQWLGGEHE